VRVNERQFSREMVRALSEPARRYEVWYDVDLLDEAKVCIGTIARVSPTHGFESVTQCGDDRDACERLREIVARHDFRRHAQS
jgi:hypothetical protein